MVDPDVIKLIKEALEEDLGSGDLTTDAILSKEIHGTAEMVAKEDLVLAGLEVAKAVFLHMDSELLFTPHYADSDSVRKGERIAVISGRAASILKAERVALNFLQHLSGVATATASFVKKIDGLPVKIMDTRKTLPGLRMLEKYAVRMGGGANHRTGLYDAVLIKDNHIAVAGGITAAVNRVLASVPKGTAIEVETTNLDEVKEALSAKADIIMLDNMDSKAMKSAVEWVQQKAEVEASGNVNLKNVREIALTGVDRISIGALTHSVRAVDISLKMEL